MNTSIQFLIKDKCLMGIPFNYPFHNRLQTDTNECYPTISKQLFQICQKFFFQTKT